MWRHNYVIDRNEYLIFTLSESINPWVFSLQFLFKSTNNSWRYERKCEWVFFSEHSVELYCHIELYCRQNKNVSHHVRDSIRYIYFCIFALTTQDLSAQCETSAFDQTPQSCVMNKSLCRWQHFCTWHNVLYFSCSSDGPIKSSQCDLVTDRSQVLIVVQNTEACLLLFISYEILAPRSREF